MQLKLLVSASGLIFLTKAKIDLSYSFILYSFMFHYYLLYHLSIINGSSQL